jgi:hypothetical protein
MVTHCFFLTGTACFSVQGVIIWAKLNFFGSWNDAEMSRQFMDILSDSDRNVDGHGVLSDSAFPVSSSMFGRIMTPLKDGDCGLGWQKKGGREKLVSVTRGRRDRNLFC